MTLDKFREVDIAEKPENREATYIDGQMRSDLITAKMEKYDQEKQKSSNILATEEKPKDYLFAGYAEENRRFGNGGGKQYYIPNAMQMKTDGRLTVIGKELDVPNDNRSNKDTTTENTSYHIYTNKNGIQVHYDHCGIDFRDLPFSDDEDTEEYVDSDNKGDWLGDLTDDDIAQLDDETGDVRFFNLAYADTKTEDYMNPHSNQEDTNGTYMPDGWFDPVDLKSGDIFYQLSFDGNTPSSYFTDEATVSSCRREDGTVDFDQLRDKLQVENGNNKICLTKYIYMPDSEDLDP